MSQKGNDYITSQEDDDEYYTVAGVPYVEEDWPEHNDSGFCDDMSHECHENQESITELNSAIQDGIIATDDADRIYHGKTVI
ncbi:MAG TPA: hypothetical protein VKY19_28975 [Ktedonosporobacter sp.]|jgi:hypothetical protein|nr:hypothetical protein [Ktedonosporobacter sp.]